MTWIQTRDGDAFDLLEPQAAQVNFSEIAHALSCIPRFGGHVPGGHYSVAQHCVVGAEYLDDREGPEVALAFLLHDAHEAYMGDIMSPVVAALGAADVAIPQIINNMKARIDHAIYQAAYGKRVFLDENLRKIVHETDLRMLATERKYLLASSPRPWADVVEAAEPLPIDGMEVIWSQRIAEEKYYRSFIRYQRELGIAA